MFISNNLIKAIVFMAVGVCQIAKIIPAVHLPLAVILVIGILFLLEF